MERELICADVARHAMRPQHAECSQCCAKLADDRVIAVSTDGGVRDS
jgi:hypothetical protein